MRMAANHHVTRYKDLIMHYYNVCRSSCKFGFVDGQPFSGALGLPW